MWCAEESLQSPACDSQMFRGGLTMQQLGRRSSEYVFGSNSECDNFSAGNVRS
jgi:hypothetical protein